MVGTLRDYQIIVSVESSLTKHVLACIKSSFIFLQLIEKKSLLQSY